MHKNIDIRHFDFMSSGPTMSWGKAVFRPDCGRSMIGFEFRPKDRSMPYGSRSVIGLEFWTNGGGSMIGFGGF